MFKKPCPKNGDPLTSPRLIARPLIYIEAPRISVIAELDSPEELTAFSIHILLIEFIRWLRSVGGSS